MAADLPTLSFASQAEFEAWLAAQPRASPGAWVKLAKKSTDAKSVTKAEAVESALAYGWIDGQLAPFDEHWWLTRFTPRRPRSKWSKINCETAERLIATGRMTRAGVAEVEAAKADGRWQAAYPSHRQIQVPDDLQAALDANPEAAAFFARLDRNNRYAILYRLHDAKKPETRARRLEQFVAMLAEGRTLHPSSKPSS